mgnify:CR=1 FL=1
MLNKKNKIKKIFCAMSGGVDSSVAAALLKNQGYSIVGVYMKNWSGDNFGLQKNCPWEKDMSDVQAVCKVLNIPFMSFNFEKEYRAKVIEYFFEEYRKGKTPNPDIMCNKEIKFDLFLKKALEEGADMIATGHYARVTSGNDNINNLKLQTYQSALPLQRSSNLEPKTYYLLKGLDTNKDQSYFLYILNQEQLSKILFPIGHLKKSDVRELARKYKLPVAEKKDSQGICFIGKINVQEFLRKVIKKKPGPIIDIDTQKKLGNHDGTMFYTIGQREGLNIGGSPEPYFVVSKDEKNNILYVAMGRENKHLFKKELQLENLHLISHKKIEQLLQLSNITCSIRYNHSPKLCKLSKDIRPSARYKITFQTPQRAITPGQSAVLYDGEICLGGGIIQK